MPNRERILVVEDNRDALAALFFVLTQAGYSVLTAEDGAQAVDLLSHGIHPRLIVLDLLLPKVDGWAVLKHLQQDPLLRRIPVIVTTAVRDARERTLGADVILSKPVEHAELIVAIRRLLDEAFT
jgi:CheY-like chemotaxis protein